MKKLLIALVLLATPAAAEAPVAFSDIIHICRVGVFSGKGTARVMLDNLNLSEQSRQAAAYLCAAYELGVKDGIKAATPQFDPRLGTKV